MAREIWEQEFDIEIDETRGYPIYWVVFVFVAPKKTK